MWWPCILFFFSSRRRHTRSLRDWSSDVCSSDLRSIQSGGRTAPGDTASAGGPAAHRHGHVVRAGATTTEVRGCARLDRKSTRLNSSHVEISYAVFCLKKKKEKQL